MNFSDSELALFDTKEESEEDIEIEETVERGRRHTVRNDQFLWEDADFKFRYRMSRDTARAVTLLIQNRIRSSSNRNNAIQPSENFLLALRFYATGSFQQVLGDIVGVHKSSVCKAIKKVSAALAELLPQFVYMPNEDEVQEVVREFYGIAQFPNVIGTIDCTHVAILSPGGDNAETYRNRKGYFSYNVQTVSDSRLKIRDIVCRWPGSVHDSTIFDHSILKDRMTARQFEGKVLLGDGGYALTPYLLTPFQNPSTPGERAYNRSHIVTRSTVERSYGVWKRRFPCVGTKLRLKKDRLQSVICATAVLHNMCIDRRETEVETEIDVNLGQF